MNKVTIFIMLLLSCMNIYSAEQPKHSHVQRSMQPRPLEPISVEVPIFQLLEKEQTGINFLNLVPGPQSFKTGSTLFSIAGGGVAVGDINKDGLVDIYLTRFMAPNKLFINKGGLRFEEAASSLGLNDSVGASFGTTMVDIDGDNDLDIFVAKYGFDANRMFINNGDGTFTDKAEEMGIATVANSIQGTFFDYDNDGDLDLFVVLNGVDRPGFLHKGVRSQLFRNNGDMTFTDVAEQAGIRHEGFGLSCTAGDINNDGWLDLYIANDFEEPDHLYLNNKNGTFSDITKKAMKHTALFSMGNDIADFNNDNYLDIYSVDMLPENHARRNTQFETMSSFSMAFDSSQMIKNCMFLNRKDTTFSDIAYMAGTAATEWSWATMFADFDLDGWKDLMVVNGLTWDVMDRDFTKFGITSETLLKLGIGKEALEFVKGLNINTDRNLETDYTQIFRNIPRTHVNNYLYKNGGNLQFHQVSEAWGFTEPYNSVAFAYADFDNDGDIDLVVNNIDSLATIYKNIANDKGTKNYLTVQLEYKEKNTEGLGARIKVLQDTVWQTIELQRTRGFVSSVDASAYFGFPSNRPLKELQVLWPDGTKQELKNIAINKKIKVIYNKAPIKQQNKTVSAQEKKIQPLFSKNLVTIPYKHQENVFDDFFRERLLPKRLSMNGPGIASADVNNDGLFDMYISSPENSRPRLFLQTTSGTFIESRQSVFDTICEQQGAVFLDIDNDNDVDLYVANGGNESITDEPERMQDRLYINDGKGNFSLGSLPLMLTSTSCVVAGDIDNDGDMDLFVGGRNVAGNYPSMPRSYVLLNNNGVFIDVTENIAASFITNPSMVQSALWTDFDNDDWLDLIVVGEWSPMRFFKNNGGQLTEITETTGVNTLYGWWNSINGGDFDNDGDIDYIVGNFGANIRYKGSEKYPIEFYANDFDKNGSIDHLMTYWENDKRYAVRSLMAFYNQMPILRKRFPLYRDYVQLSFDDVFSKGSLDSSHKMTLNAVHSLYLENLGKGKFKPKSLPPLAQLSPIFGSAIQDFDEDGNLDIVISGNFYGPDVEAWRYDAGYGLLLRGDGKGGFIPQDALSSGICIHGDSRGIIALPSYNNTRIALCAPTNGGYVQTFISKPLNSEIVMAAPTQRYAVVELKNGKNRKHEFYCGSGYLSQSANFLVKSKQVKKVTLKSGR